MDGTGLAARAQRGAPLAAAFTALMLIFCAPAAAVAALPEAVDFWGMPPNDMSVKPQQLIWATDVSQPNFGGTKNNNSALRWSSWTATSAAGSGALWVPKLLPPNGSKLSFTSYPVTLAFSAPKKLTFGTKLNATGAPYKTVTVFTKLKVTFTGKVPARWRHSATFSLKKIALGKHYKGFYGISFPT